MSLSYVATVERVCSSVCGPANHDRMRPTISQYAPQRHARKEHTRIQCRIMSQQLLAMMKRTQMTFADSCYQRCASSGVLMSF